MVSFKDTLQDRNRQVVLNPLLTLLHGKLLGHRQNLTIWSRITGQFRSSLNPMLRRYCANRSAADLQNVFLLLLLLAAWIIKIRNVKSII